MVPPGCSPLSIALFSASVQKRPEMTNPCLDKVYRHYVLDDWFHNTWGNRMAGGDTIIVRYADDCVCGFQHPGDAEP